MQLTSVAPNTGGHGALCELLEVLNPHNKHCCLCCPTTDSKAIVDGNLKLILGLIWTLILHYSISMPMWDDEDDEETKKLTPKQRLLGWIQNKVPQLPINNFNRDWRDGKALGALVDNCAPGKKCVSWLQTCLRARGGASAESEYVRLLLKGLLCVAVFLGCHGGWGQACVSQCV